MGLIQIDCWGRPANHSKFGNGNDHPISYQTDVQTTFCYDRFHDDAEGVVIRTRLTNPYIKEVGFGAWTDRATLTYQPVNEPLVIDDSKVSELYK